MAKKILITSKYCGGCAEAKRELKAHGIRFTEVSADTKSGEKLADKFHIMAVPTMIIDGKKTDDMRKWFSK